MAGGGSAASGVGGRAATLGGRRQLAGQVQAAARRRGHAASYWTWGSRSACPSTHGSQNVAVEMEEEEGQMEEHVVQELGEECVEENFEGITEFNPDYIISDPGLRASP
uniref:Uncharacterized protein n=2 Tax=Oryza sativa subsp. japonica TaxID=39947 RepID=Q53NY6_ORYSJ|nr:hypothetical protein LOC_Os11g17920 [Oryza sativa Japonica Group]ABA92696.1 hypothetical protein LOC_Os11g17920 [Oryza sativa Japonica Group]